MQERAKALALDPATPCSTKAKGLQDAQLDNGSRLHIVDNDIGQDGHVLVNIRKFSGIQIRRLDELVERDMLDGPPSPAPHLLRRRARPEPARCGGRGSF